MDVRSEENLNRLIGSYLERNTILLGNQCWTIKRSSLGGFGLFATRNIQPGDVIFLDSPIIIGPRFLQDLPIKCIGCYSKSSLLNCLKCSLPVCPNCNHEVICKKIQELCPKVSDNQTLFKCLTPLLSLFVPEEDKDVIRCLKYHKGAQHGQEIEVLTEKLGFKIMDEEREFLIRVCSVLDANAFEVIVGNEEEKQTSLRGLYPLAGLANHRCYPNTFHVFDDKKRMVVRASMLIAEGEEIFHSYSRIIWATTTRIYHLRHSKHFICKCERCLDTTEFGTYMSAIFCKKCKGNVIPLEPTKKNSWRCEDCQTLVPAKDVGDVLCLIGSVLRSLDDVDFKILHSFLIKKLNNLVPETNQASVEVKYKIVWVLGYKPGYEFQDLPLELLTLKINYCKDILALLKKLRVGMCKMRGLLLYEIYLCLEEGKKRESNNNNSEDSAKYLHEAAHILKHDVGAPKIIKRMWESFN